ncbi:MAG: DNA-binding protein [Desulfobulbus propionicus]|nr:MAG: DNA-binding protein [Desulfobulbus propionicus]
MRALFATLFALTLVFSSAFPIKAQTGEPAHVNGKIIETMDAAGYTYLLLDNDREQTWVAIPETSVKKGQEVKCAPGMVMKDFTSTTLDRFFPVIIFSSGILPEGEQQQETHNDAAASTATNSFEAALQAEAAANAHAGLNIGENTVASSGSAGAIVPLADIKVDKAGGNSAITVEEAFSRAKELDGTTVRIQGQVVKNSRMIMGRNWVHLQDGSGDPGRNTHDLVITTQADPVVGKIIVLEGVLHADRDFGAGYTYKVIIEEAKEIR